jgi:pimeloyl-ACP methyl ester carboxylesterase
VLMATYVLVHGAGSDSWYWHLVAPLLRERDHEVVTPDLPCDDDAAGVDDYASAVVDAIGDRQDVILVAQSMAAFTVPLVCDAVAVDLVVLVAAMTPRAGESPGEWWDNTGQAEAKRAQAERDGRPDSDDPVETFLHDALPDVAAESANHVRNQSATPFRTPYPMPPWPEVPTRFLLCRDDRFFPADFQRRVVHERLGLTPDEMGGGHLPALSRPRELVERLEGYRSEQER